MISVYFGCNQRLRPLHTIVDNPDTHIKCSNCGFKLFHEITKKEYDQMRQTRRAKP